MTVTATNTTYGIENPAENRADTFKDCLGTQEFPLNLAVSSTCSSRILNPIQLFNKGTTVPCEYAEVVAGESGTYYNSSSHGID